MKTRGERALLAAMVIVVTVSCDPQWLVGRSTAVSSSGHGECIGQALAGSPHVAFEGVLEVAGKRTISRGCGRMPSEFLYRFSAKIHHGAVRVSPAAENGPQLSVYFSGIGNLDTADATALSAIADAVYTGLSLSVQPATARVYS